MFSPCNVHATFWLACWPDINTQALEEIYPFQMTEQSPGSFSWTYLLRSNTSKSIYLAIDSAAVQPVNISNIQHVPPTLDLLDRPSRTFAGQPISLQLNTSVIGFSAAWGDPWHVSLTRPDNSSIDYGGMIDWEVWQGVVFKWRTSMDGSYFQQVRQQMLPGFMCIERVRDAQAFDKMGVLETTALGREEGHGLVNCMP